MKPSRIVKSAYHKAGSKLSLKNFARENRDRGLDSILRHACFAWLAAKGVN